VAAFDVFLFPLAHILKLLFLDQVKLKTFIDITAIKECLRLFDVHCSVLLDQVLILIYLDPWLLVGLGLLVGQWILAHELSLIFYLYLRRQRHRCLSSYFESPWIWKFLLPKMVTFMIVSIKHSDIIYGGLDSNTLSILKVFEIVTKLLASAGE
jgi:hypothetical protein